ncbi:protein kinase family protein [Burkholderiales bacterium JOSHI_001]|nr:protein kinase family protein [Burkholderiales bacterium JOSHI_001]
MISSGADTQPGQSGGAAIADLGGCRLLRRLGGGRGAEVFEALDLGSGETVALKRLAVAVDATPAQAREWRERFLREAQVLQQLQHPDILHLRRFGVDAAQAWMVTDLVAGGDLGRHVRAPALLPPQQVAALGARLAAALHHAHGRGVLHRDLKPANVLADLPAGVLRLADFGLARLDGAAATRTGLNLGSPAYSAPEQLAGLGETPATDVWGLGVTLFELLAGRLPFESDSLGQLLRQVAQAPAPDLRLLRPDLPPGLAEAVAWALQKPPQQRPTTADALAQALRRCAAAGA